MGMGPGTLTIVVRLRIVPTIIMIGGLSAAAYIYYRRNKSLKEKTNEAKQSSSAGSPLPNS